MTERVESAADGGSSGGGARGVQPLITGREKRWLAVILVWFMLAAAAITAPVAIALFRPPRAHIATEITLRDGDVGNRTWPTHTPHEEPWPAPDIWDETREIGFRYFQVRALGKNPEANRFMMEVHQYGFPLPIVERVQYWWDWNDPALKGPEATPALRLLWRGLVLNPLIVGGIAYLVLMAPILMFILGRRIARRAAGSCIFCGYPRGESPICTECGRTLNGITREERSTMTLTRADSMAPGAS